VGEVQSLSLGDEWLELWPSGGLSGVGEKVHDDGSSVDGLLDREEGLSGNLEDAERAMPSE
jgi:hypothetical protein